MIAMLFGKKKKKKRKKTVESFLQKLNFGFINHRWKGVVMGCVAEHLVLVVLRFKKKKICMSSSENYMKRDTIKK